MTDEQPRLAEGMSTSSLQRAVEQALHADAKIDDGEPGAEAAVARMLISEGYTGTFAHPAILKGLNEVVENGAERAFALTEREQQHRHDCDKQALTAEIRDVEKAAFDRRMIIIFLLVFLSASVIASFTAALLGNPGAAAIAGAFGAATIVGGLIKLAPSRDSKSSAKEGS